MKHTYPVLHLPHLYCASVIQCFCFLPGKRACTSSLVGIHLTDVYINDHWMGGGCITGGTWCQWATCCLCFYAAYVSIRQEECWLSTVITVTWCHEYASLCHHIRCTQGGWAAPKVVICRRSPDINEDVIRRRGVCIKIGLLFYSHWYSSCSLIVLEPALS